MFDGSDTNEIYGRSLDIFGRDTITDKTVYHYCISPFMVYCEKFGPEIKKDFISRYQKFLNEQARLHRKHEIEKLYYNPTIVEYETRKEGFEVLLDGMVAGVTVMCDLPGVYFPERLAAVFDIVEKRESESSLFGDYHYIVKDIIFAKNIKQHHRIKGAFLNYLLGKIQGYTPPMFYLINRDGEQIEQKYEEEKLIEILDSIKKILRGEKVTPVYGDNYGVWPWNTYNTETAKEINDISLVCGVGKKLKQDLVKKGITTVDDLANIKIQDLVKILMGKAQKTKAQKTKAKLLRCRAKALMSQKHTWLSYCNLPETINEFPAKEVEIFMDFETINNFWYAEEVVDIDYLIGVVTSINGKVEYTPFIAHQLDKEKAMFHQFIGWLSAHTDFVIYHWWKHEETRFNNLVERYGLSQDIKKKIYGNMRDLYVDATSRVVFPTYGNGLKDIAPYLGYCWKHEDVNANECTALYFQYIKNSKKDTDKLQKILDYNEDDCRALLHIKDWLQKEDEKKKKRKKKKKRDNTSKNEKI